jgi:hypothetical protein
VKDKACILSDPGVKNLVLEIESDAIALSKNGPGVEDHKAHEQKKTTTWESCAKNVFKSNINKQVEQKKSWFEQLTSLVLVKAETNNFQAKEDERSSASQGNHKVK